VSDSHETKALAIIPRSLEDLTKLSELLAKSELLPKALRGKVPDVAMTIMAGQEMGFTPMASLRSFHVIEGRPVLSASGKVALVRASGKCKYFDCVEDTADRVTYETMRFDSTKPHRATWTKQRVKDAGLNTKDNHRLFGQQMLHARAKSELCEMTYEDVIGGTYTQEEMGDWSPPQRPDNVIDADFTEQPADNEPMPHEILALEHTKSEAEVKEMGPVLAKLPTKWRETANEKYKARLKFHREQPAAAADATDTEVKAS
jgi:hypothetical protein